MKILVICVLSICLSFAISSRVFAQETSSAQIVADGETVIGIYVPGPVVSIGPEAKPVKPAWSRLTHSGPAGGAQAALVAPNPPSKPVLPPGPGFSGFPGLTHLDQRLAGAGIYANSQLNTEPPDQMLAVGNGFILEGVNDALAAYDAKTHKLLSGPTPFNQFFKLAPELIRSTRVFGPFLTDPRAYFDPEIQRWFVTITEIDVNPTTGKFFNTHSHVELAVSKTGNPTLGWNLFSIDTTNDGNAIGPHGPICPCFGDQPLIATDANGFYITTNSFSIAQPFTTGAQIYAMSKFFLAAGLTPPIVRIGGLSADGINPAFSIQPATHPPGEHADFDASSGVEYFMSALDPDGTVDNRIAVWALTNTFSLIFPHPAVHLSEVTIKSEVYGVPPDVAQKPGPTPLGTNLKEGLELIVTDDDRMNQVVFAQGKLWGALNTVVGAGSDQRAGIAYFIVRPSWEDHGRLKADIVKEGYVAISPGSIMYPALGVNAAGFAVMGFSIVGPDRFPSAAYALIDEHHGAGDVRLAAAGTAPEDGFTGYEFYGGNGHARWGDYSAAVADAEGSIWFATEYIPGGPRALLANWGSFIGKVTHEDE